MNPSEKPEPMFKRARYRRSYWQEEDLIIDEDGTILNDEWYGETDEDFDDDEDQPDDPDSDTLGGADAPFWTRRRVLMLILALIILLSMLAADLQGILLPPPTLPPFIPVDPGPLI